jgi:holo-[acyl-carrier protein] synthase
VIYGVGTDMVDVSRIADMLARHGERAAAKLLTRLEMDKYRGIAQPASFLAKRFAAKEALGKALGLGLRAPATLHNIGVVHDALGKPCFEFAPPLAAWLAERRLRAHLSISDDGGAAMAFVVVERESNP